ncbi:MAG TPA: chitobiase/beta-hexosaminidase C-terminal domain-containing protein [Opitutaceae bacterium]|jgi:hypothetical protein|nr:chitobiase/beta-hexosaminidase C-terminal domain-containing protein [Opitutaceae bacterium]
MKTLMSRALACASILGLLGIGAVQAATTTVTSISALQTAINGANAGDTIILKNGSYATSSAITINRTGTSAAPIVIKAETIGGATITGSGPIVFTSPAAWCTVQGFVLKHSGSLSIPTGTSHCRYSRNVIQLSIPSGSTVSYIQISGDDAEIDYNDLGNKSSLGEMLDISGSGSQVARRLWVHHNYFHDFAAQSGNGAETIRWGLSGLSLSTGDGICEYNLFLRCSGENEVISNKSCGNTYRFNTLLDCSNGGQISQRHGNSCLYYGNYIKNSSGIRIYGDSHQVFSNYLEGNDIAINIGNGDGDVESGAALTSHDRPDNCVITFNTLVNNTTQYEMNGRSGGLGATHTTFANNIIQGGTTAVNIASSPYTNPVWSGNIIWKTTNVGNIPSSGYTSVNPLLAADANGVFRLQSGSPAIGTATGSYPNVTVDMDGQPRPDTGKDKGADQFSTAPVTAKFLVASDVGPNADLTTTPPAAAPVFSPAAGTYATAQNVTITTSTSGATIRYTTDGSTPSETNGTIYTGSAVTINSTATLQAIAYETGFTDSPVTAGIYTISVPKAAAPVFNPVAGTYNNDQSVAITSATSSASINYTSDGSMPTETHGTLYGSPVTINATTTLQALAFGSGLADSTVSIAPYTLVVAPVTFSPAAGAYASAQTVTLSTATNGAIIRYTLDGSTPSETSGTIYSTLITVSTTSTLKAIAYKAGYSDAPVTSATYTIGSGNPVAVTFEAENLSPVGTGATVSISNNSGASGGVVEFLNSTATGQIMTFTTPSIVAGTYQFQLRYWAAATHGQHTVKIDGTQIGGTVDQYAATAAFLTTTLGNVTFSTAGPHSIALTVTGKNASATKFLLTADSFTFTPVTVQPQAAAPSFSPAAGTYSTVQNVTITSSTSGATIRYTTDGSTPSETAGTIYSGPVNISSTKTLKAIAYESGFTDSPVTSGTYTITVTPPPTLNFEAESLTNTPSGATASVQTDTNSSGGKWVELAGNSVGDSISFALPSIAAGTYQIQMEWKGNNSRGILQLSVDGTNLGSTLDQYSAAQSYPTTTFGTVTFASAGTHTVKLTVTGKNSASSAEQLSADKFTFVGQ